jgi:hypothetical protein
MCFDSDEEWCAIRWRRYRRLDQSRSHAHECGAVPGVSILPFQNLARWSIYYVGPKGIHTRVGDRRAEEVQHALKFLHVQLSGGAASGPNEQRRAITIDNFLASFCIAVIIALSVVVPPPVAAVAGDIIKMKGSAPPYRIWSAQRFPAYAKGLKKRLRTSRKSLE